MREDNFWNYVEMQRTAAEESPSQDGCSKCDIPTFCANKESCWETPGQPCQGHKYGPPHVCPIGGNSCPPHCTRSGHY